MAKTVRIENADCSDHKLVVHVEVRNFDGKWYRTDENYPLNNPTSMLTQTIWDSKRLVVEEMQ